MLTPLSARGSARRGSIADEPSSGRRRSISARVSRLAAPVSIPRSQRSESGSVTPTRYRSDVSVSPRRVRVEGYETPAATKANAMKVYIRVRPFSEREIAQKTTDHSTIRIDAENPSVITILEPSRGFRPLSTHIFNRCFWSVFETSKNGAENSQVEIRAGVDTFLNGGMNSARRSRAQSIVGQPGVPLSARRASRLSLETDGQEQTEAPAYEGAGSAPVMVDANVSHPPYAGQDEVYNHVGKPIVDNTLDGYNGCIFAYGQTGSGKTFTMLGYAPSRSDIRARRESMTTSTSIAPDDASTAYNNCDPFESDDGDDVVDKTGLDPNELQGIIPRSCADLFDGLHVKREKDSDFTYRVEVSYYEIYNEKVFDLIRPQRNTDLRIRNTPNSGPFVEGLTWKLVNKEEDVARVIRKGMQERHTAATKFNDRSSRSHAILSFNIVQLSMDESDNAFQMRSKLNLVDLAGSERTGAAGAEGDEFHDGVKINQSLTVLGRVIDRLADLSQNKGGGLPVPYRDSNLTWVLSDSIGGNSQTSMIATISPHVINYEEMRQTIRYASRAKNIINWVKKNEDPQVVMIRELRDKVANLELRLKEAGGSNYTNEYVRGLEKRVKELEKKCAEQERIVAALRAELEYAGITDPTAQEGFLDPENKAKMDQQKAKAEEAMKKQLEKAQMTIAELKAELERRANTIEPERLKAMKEKLERQDSRLHALTTQVMLYKRLWQYFDSVDAVMELVEDKENLLLRACGNALSSTSTESSALIARMNTEREEDLAELKRRHDEELAAQADRFRARLKDTLDDSAAQQQQLLDRHKDAIAQLEGRLQRTRELNEQERKRSDEENELFRQKLLDAQERMRLEYQQDVEKLRAHVEGDVGERQKNSDAMRQLQDAHNRDTARMNEEVDRLKRSKDVDVSRLQNQLENERLRRESDLMEKDRQMRLVRNEVEDSKRALDKLNDEKNKMEKEYQDQIRDLMLQQEQLIAVSNAVLADWENKSSTLEADLHKLRGLVYDKDYMSFRQKIRDMAFMERENYDQKFQELDEKEKLQAARIGQIISKARRANDEQHRTLKRFERDVKERIGGRTKGLTSSDNGSSQGSPPSELISMQSPEAQQH
ncbi:putative kinesin [Leptomonas pyrrhocoris]|uniref:Putative kinesin n=1 Tax=Leptomonas pyrrhocoris TaxID=157538 RepID=A0A0N0VGB9_LEPPY|nr:putative kinesin [Leptomonas pyrrhocoris]KPA82698.1 putative kinesin [Leptomonas pyrrhocoris]|eukprot:XP_015661137.1 putative kinesin [Leptomonas pyrrhocoris]